MSDRKIHTFPDMVIDYHFTFIYSPFPSETQANAFSLPTSFLNFKNTQVALFLFLAVYVTPFSPKTQNQYKEDIQYHKPEV